MFICPCHALTSSQLTLPPPRVLKSILYICVFIPVLPLGSSEHYYYYYYYYFRLHIYVLAYGICFSLSDSLHSVWQSVGPSTSLQRACENLYKNVCRRFIHNSPNLETVQLPISILALNRRPGRETQGLGGLGQGVAVRVGRVIWLFALLFATYMYWILKYSKYILPTAWWSLSGFA